MPLNTQNKRRSITEIERRWILTLAETHHAGLWVRMMLYCGLRPGEIIALQWRDIDFKKKLVKITKAKESGKNDIKEPKTEAGNRNVPIPDILLADLKLKKGDPFQPVFTQLTNDRPHTEASFYCAWGNFIREMNIANGAKVYRNQIKISVVAPDLSPYCLRHTFCTDLEAAGVPINVAKYLMGHSDISVTANIYTHTTDKVIAAAAEKMNSAANGDGANIGATSNEDKETTA
jgi:integrase